MKLNFMRQLRAGTRVAARRSAIVYSASTVSIVAATCTKLGTGTCFVSSEQRPTFSIDAWSADISVAGARIAVPSPAVVSGFTAISVYRTATSFVSVAELLQYIKRSDCVVYNVGTTT